jgi:class 3 adenylate cyclase
MRGAERWPPLQHLIAYALPSLGPGEWIDLERAEAFMPIFLDRHDLSGLTAADIAEAHRKDLEVQERYGVRFLTYWFDETRGTGFCLIDAPDIETAMRVHDEAHGDVAKDVIEVDLSAVEAFLGRVSDPTPTGPKAETAFDPAFRAIMFTDLVDSTGMTARLGDARSVEMVRAHDALVRRALKDKSGREVKHTGDGIMASFDSAPDAVECARRIQQAFEAFNLASQEKLRVRIGLDAGEPIEDSNDLFGVTVQTAARLCQAAEPDGILVSGTIRRLLSGPFETTEFGLCQLKGFANPVTVYEVAWR